MLRRAIVHFERGGPSVDELDVLGLPVLDSGGARLGDVLGVSADAATGEPVFLIVALTESHRPEHPRALVPAGRATVEPGDVAVRLRLTDAEWWALPRLPDAPLTELSAAALERHVHDVDRALHPAFHARACGYCAPARADEITARAREEASDNDFEIRAGAAWDSAAEPALRLPGLRRSGCYSSFEAARARADYDAPARVRIALARLWNGPPPAPPSSRGGGRDARS
jgi:hypothetical protein